ncbi:MAG TPA: DUF2017 domain-containing protein [Mycobacteriales bacterium]|nr:DUF2017 domain-containing protein [Mycobacteriales bacterium]
MGSVRRRGGAVRLGLDDSEVVLLASLAAQVKQLLGGEGSAGPVDPMEAMLALPPEAIEPPQDPVLARLLPNAYRDDDAAAGEFRRLMDSDLRAQKCLALQQVIDDLAGAGGRKGGQLRLELPEAAAERWLYALTDVRLALGTTLGVTEDMDEERRSAEPGSSRHLQLGVYDWVTWLQDAMVRAVTGG